MSALDAIRAVDRANQLDDVLALPDHLRDALWRVESARLEPQATRGLVVCGMGGSAIGADLARAAFGERLELPLTTVREYRLPGWVGEEHLVLCSSYSGNTEETISCFDAAGERGVRRVVATTGGALGERARAAGVPVIPMPAALQPRAAVGYVLTAAAEVAAVAGAARSLRREIEAAADALAQRLDALAEQAAELAATVGDAVPVIYGCDLSGALAYRWKTQVNENAKQHAFVHALPEMDHNEIVGWSDAGPRFAAIFLADPDQNERERRRIELTAELIRPAASSVTVVELEGASRCERLVTGISLGDLFSLQLAARRGIDPTPVEVIERLKDELGRP